MDEIINYLKENEETISTMESATGGALASSITNISGSSQVFKFGAVTYSNEYKIKMGVLPSIISKYSVYSLECARAMSLAITNYTTSNYGVSVTGKINDKDPYNKYGLDNEVFVSLYVKKSDRYYDKVIKVKNQTRKLNKELVIEEFINLFKEMLEKEKGLSSN